MGTEVKQCEYCCVERSRPAVVFAHFRTQHGGVPYGRDLCWPCYHNNRSPFISVELLCGCSSAQECPKCQHVPATPLCPGDPGGSTASDKKDTNPKDAIGIAKVPMLSVWPLRVMAEVALALFEGARKYARHNYRVAGVRASVYLDATGRHLADFWEGVDIDPDSGIHHISKAIASLVVLRDGIMQGNWVDDRPPRVQDAAWVKKANEKAKEIIAKHPNAPAPYTEVGLKGGA